MPVFRRAYDRRYGDRSGILCGDGKTGLGARASVAVPRARRQGIGVTSLDHLSSDQRFALQRLFGEALSLPPHARAGFVTSECGTDLELRKALTTLLSASDASDGYFEKLAEQLVGPALTAIAGSSRDDPADIGQRVSHYEVLERVIGGGMGIVYKARDLRLGRTVALKFLPPQLAADHGARARLLAEAQTASALDHSNIGVVYEVAESDEKRPFIAMAWYEGETLREKLRGGPLPVADAVRIAGDVASALAAAHAAGIIHMDVKPSNVLITPSGTVKLVDFGIAKLIGTGTTAEHVTRGTVAYMSPEQTQGGDVDRRTDLWSLGVLFYEMLTGERPFRGESDGVVVHAIRNDEPREIVALRRDVPPALSRVVKRCLEKQPAHRFANAEEFSAALRAGMSDAGGMEWGFLERARTEGGFLWRRHKATVIVAGALALLLVASGGWALVRNRGDVRKAAAITAAADQLASVAVVPFANRDGDSADDHFSAGFTDEVIRAIGKLPALKVVGRASVSSLTRQGLSLRAIGDRFGVETVLGGSVRRAGGRLQVTAQLMSVANGAVLWSAEYDRPVVHVFAVQQEISDAVVRTLAPRQSAGGRARAAPPTDDLQAYELYLKGRFAWEYRTQEKREEALIYYRRAIERDPEFAIAYSTTADAYVNMSNFGQMPSAEALALADVAAKRAIALDSSLADAHTSRGFVLASKGEFAASDSSFRRAIQLNPNYPWAHHYYSLLLMMLGRLDEAANYNRRALLLDPLSAPASATTGIILGQRGQYQQSRVELVRAVALSPDFLLSRYSLGAVEARNGNYAAALEALEPARSQAPGFSGVVAALAYTYRRIGRHAAAERLIKELRLAVKDERSRINYALGLAVVGEADSAFAMLEAARWDVWTLLELRANPLLEDFRRDPRYGRTLERAGLRP